MSDLLKDAGPLLSVSERARLRMTASRNGHSDVASWTDEALVSKAGIAPKPANAVAAVLSPAEAWEEDRTLPIKAATATATVDAADEMAAALRKLLQAPAPSIDAEQVRAIVNAELAQLDRPRVVHLHVAGPGDAPPVVIEGAHPALETLVRMLDPLAAVGMAPMLTGPAGSGKTTAAIQAAKALGRAVYVQPGAALVDPCQLTGFRDAHGNVEPTPLIRAMKEGALFVLDEFDATVPSVQLALNAVLSHRRAMTPDGEVEGATGFAIIAAANTIGQGASAAYRGRYAQDAAALDRYAAVHVDFDAALEDRLADNRAAVKQVRAIRAAVDKLGMAYVVGMRASIGAAALVRAGMTLEEALDAVVWSKVAPNDRSAIRGAI